MWNDEYIDQFELTDNRPGWHNEEVGFLESAKRSYDYMSKTRLTSSSKPMEADIFDRNIKLQGMIDAGVIDARSFYRPPEKVSAFSVGTDHYDFDKLAGYAKEHGFDVETDGEIQDRYRKDALKSAEAFKQTDSIAGMLVGGMAAEMTDPVMVSSMLLGIGAARSIGTVARMGMLAIENAGMESITIPDKRAYAEVIDQEYGPKEAAFDVLMAAGMPVVLDAGIRGVGKALKNIPNRTKQTDDLADTLIEAPEERTLEEHFAAQEQAINNVEAPKKKVVEDDLPNLEDAEIDKQFELLDDPEARADLDEINKNLEYADIIQACVTGKL